MQGVRYLIIKTHTGRNDVSSKDVEKALRAAEKPNEATWNRKLFDEVEVVHVLYGYEYKFAMDSYQSTADVQNGVHNGLPTSGE